LAASRWALTPRNLLTRYGRDDDYGSPDFVIQVPVDVRPRLGAGSGWRGQMAVAGGATWARPECGHGVDGADGEFGAKVDGGTVEPEGGRGIGQLGAPGHWSCHRADGQAEACERVAEQRGAITASATNCGDDPGVQQMTSVQLIIGLVLLLGGGEAMVKGSVAVAKRLGVSPLLIGLTLVGFGTSTPELVASLRAAQIGAPGIAIGNIVGSTIANILLILGLSAVLVPLARTKEAFRRDAQHLPALGLEGVLRLMRVLMTAFTAAGSRSRIESWAVSTQSV
jgi:hypothetical protein